MLTNSTGTAAGALLFSTRLTWLTPAPRRAARLSLVASLVVLATVLTTGWLLQTSLPRSRYFGHLDRYRWTVLDASVGGIPTPSWEIDSSAAVRSLLLEGAPVRVHAIAGPLYPGLGSLFSIADHRQGGILLIGPDRDDLVLQIRPRAADVRLDHPSRRFRGILDGVHPGDTLDVVVSGRDNAICIELNDREDCDLGFSAGVGWTFIQNISTLPPWAEEGMNALWMMLLVIPFGFWRGAAGQAKPEVCCLLQACSSLRTGHLAPLGFPEWAWGEDSSE